jgi:hypothetical protein
MPFQLETRVVNLKTSTYDIFIGRGSIWGNPYSHLRDSKAKFVVQTREEAIEKYRQYIMNKPELLKRLWELKGKVLGCYCKPLSCHGDILVELINEHCK